MKPALKPRVIVEGVDGSGKTTLVHQLSNDLNLEIIPTSNPPKNWNEALEHIYKTIKPNTVSDRSIGLISELVYGPVLRGRTLVDEKCMWRIVEYMIYITTFIYCRPSFDTSRNLKFRDDEGKDHIQGVLDRYNDLKNRYDNVMGQISTMGGRVLIYDRFSQNPADLTKHIRC